MRDPGESFRDRRSGRASPVSCRNERRDHRCRGQTKTPMPGSYCVATPMDDFTVDHKSAPSCSALPFEGSGFFRSIKESIEVPLTLKAERQRALAISFADVLRHGEPFPPELQVLREPAVLPHGSILFVDRDRPLDLWSNHIFEGIVLRVERHLCALLLEEGGDIGIRGSFQDFGWAARWQALAAPPFADLVFDFQWGVNLFAG